MDQTPSSSNLHNQAIDASLDCNWAEAVELNKVIIQSDPENTDALNRLAKAYMELGEFDLAKDFYSESLKFDPYNPIASKNLKLIKSFKSNGDGLFLSGHNKISATLFLQEPGKTKIVNLLKVAEPQKLSKAFCGMQVEIVTKNKKITITDSNGNYLGILPDDVSHNLLRLIKGGNRYDVFVKSIKINGLSILIRETFRSKKFRNQPSFLDSLGKDHKTEIISHLDKRDVDAEDITDDTEEPQI